MNNRIIVEDNQNHRLDKYMSITLDDISRQYIKSLICEGKIKVNSKPSKPSYKLNINDVIEYAIPQPQKYAVEAENIPISIIYEDTDIIIVNKEKGMVVHPAPGNYCGTMVNALMYHCGDKLSSINGVIRPGIVHRIDKDTSGLLVVAKNNTTHEFLSKQFQEHSINRIYKALVKGVIEENRGRVEAPIARHKTDRKRMTVNINKGKSAITHFNVIERFSNYSYVEFKLETGRTHQIRVHMSYINHPVIGDEVYGSKKSKFKTNGQVLHAETLGFIHPSTKEWIEFKSELPGYFKEILEDFKNENILL